MKDFDGRTAVVTGAASGIGFALSVKFAALGMNVTMADVDKGRLEVAAAQVAAQGGAVLAVPTDVSDEDSVQRLADRAVERFGAVSVLCNNAGVETGNWFADIPTSAWRWVLDVDLLGVVYGCRSFLPILRQQEEAHIVNTGSLSSFNGRLVTFGPYAAAKFAVLGISENLAEEFAVRGERIGVTVLTPGVVRTEMIRAERNRPAGVPPTRSVPIRAQVLDTIAEQTELEGMPAAAVADVVVDAIRQERFFALTHPDEAIELIETRLALMRASVS